MFLNLGDLGANIKSYVDEYQTKTKSNMNIESIADMKRFVEDYPEFRKLSGNVSKHVTLVGELSRLVDQGNVLEVSELEQSLACTDSHNNDLKVYYLRLVIFFFYRSRLFNNQFPFVSHYRTFNALSAVPRSAMPAKFGSFSYMPFATKSSKEMRLRRLSIYCTRTG